MHATLSLNRPVIVPRGGLTRPPRRRRRRVISPRRGRGRGRGRGVVRVRGQIGSGSDSDDSLSPVRAGAAADGDDSVSNDRSSDASGTSSEESSSEYTSGSGESSSGDDSSSSSSGSYEEPMPATISAPVAAAAAMPSAEQLNLAKVHATTLAHPEVGTKLLHMQEVACGACGKQKSSLPAFDDHDCNPIDVDIDERERTVQCVHIHRNEYDVIEPCCEEGCGLKKKCDDSESSSSSSSEKCKKKKKKKHHHKKKAHGCAKPACNKTEHHKSPVDPSKNCKPACHEDDVVTTESYDCWMKDAPPCNYCKESAANVCGSLDAACHPFDAREMVRAIKAEEEFKVKFAHRYVSHKPIAFKAKQANEKVPAEALQYIHVELAAGAATADGVQYATLHVMPMSVAGKVVRTDSAPKRIYKIKKLADGTRKVSVIGKNLDALKSAFGVRKEAVEQAHAHMSTIFGRNF